MTKLKKTKLKAVLSQNPRVVATFYIGRKRLNETLRILNLETEQQLATFIEKWAQVYIREGKDLKFLKFRIEQQTECYLSCSLSYYIDAYMHSIDIEESFITEEMQNTFAFIESQASAFSHARSVN